MPTERRARALALGLALLLAPACGDPDAPPTASRRAVAVAELPAPVRDAARKALPEIDFSDAWRNLDRDGATHSFEVRGRAPNGKIREVRVSPEGRVLEME